MDPLLIFLFVFLFLLSAFFSWTEIALMSIPNHKVESLIKQKKFGSYDLKYITSKSDRLLTTILIWNNLVNVYVASLATQISIKIAETSWLEQSFIIGISTWVITFLLLIFGEIFPKSLWIKYAELISLIVAKPYRFLMYLFFPVTFFIEILIKTVTWKTQIPKITDEEMESFIDLWKDTWLLEAAEHEKIKNMLEFADITVEEILTPRVKMDAIDINKTVDEAIDYVLNVTHSRIPVYSEKIDNINFVVDLRFLLQEKQKWNWAESLTHLTKMDKIIKVPINLPIDSLLETFRNSRKHIALVMDEHGWVEWLVTLEDVIEQVFWEIRDEYDKEKESIRKIWEDRFEVESSVIFEDLLDTLELSFDNLGLDEAYYHATTLNYFITEELERFPITWDIIKKQILRNDDENLEENLNLYIKVWNVIDSKIEKISVYIK